MSNKQSAVQKMFQQRRMVKRILAAKADMDAKHEEGACLGVFPGDAERNLYLMTRDEFGKFVDACNPPQILTSDPNSTLNRAIERVSAFWTEMGDKYGFVPSSAQPVAGRHHGYFTGVPVEDVTDVEPKAANDGAVQAVADALGDEIPVSDLSRLAGDDHLDVTFHPTPRSEQ